MFILKKGHQPGVYVPLRALFLVVNMLRCFSSGLVFNWNQYHTSLLVKHQNDNTVQTSMRVGNKKNHFNCPAAPVAEWVRSLYFSALNHSIISPLCLVSVQAPHWPHM